MATNFKMRDVSGWMIFICGLLALLFGLAGLNRHKTPLSLLSLYMRDSASRRGQ